MARVHHVKTSRKEHTCGTPTGSHVIPAGEGYSWAKPGFRTRTPKIRCARHPFRQSELTTSMAAEPLAAVEALEDALEGLDHSSGSALDEITSAVEEFASAVREYEGTRQEALDAWENGNSTLEELHDTAEQAADEAESHQVEEWSWSPASDETDPEEARDDEDHEEHEEALAAWIEHVEEQAGAALDMAQGLEF